jgi:hypothetical protein
MERDEPSLLFSRPFSWAEFRMGAFLLLSFACFGIAIKEYSTIRDLREQLAAQTSGADHWRGLATKKDCK